jgi:hypothetical protein
MRELLVRYLLGELSADEQSQLEERLRESPELRGELAYLQKCFAETNDVELPPADPPRGLAERTSQRVASASCAPEDINLFDVASGRMAAFAGSADPPVGSLGWSLADIAVAAGVCMAMAMLLAPALRNSQDASRRNSCADNQRAAYFIVAQYADRHNGLLPAANPGEFAGVYFVRMIGEDLLGLEEARRRLVCSGSPLGEAVRRGEAEIFIPSDVQVSNAQRTQLASLFATSTGSYAVPLPFVQNNQWKCPQLSDTDVFPILADAPNLSVANIESQNHFGGLLVTYSDGSVKFQTAAITPHWNDRIYVNLAGKPAAGLDKHDSVLVPGDHMPEIIPIGRPNSD